MTKTSPKLLHYKVILICYSTVNSNPNDYPFISQSVNNENESLAKVSSGVNYLFPLPSFLNWSF